MSAGGRWCVLTSQQSSSMLLTCALVFGRHVVAAFTFSSLCSFGEICNGWDLAKVGSYWECEGGKVGKTQGEGEKERHVAKAYSIQYSLVVSPPSTHQARHCFASEIRSHRVP